jgi:hypothetical protein
MLHLPSLNIKSEALNAFFILKNINAEGLNINNVFYYSILVNSITIDFNEKTFFKIKNAFKCLMPLSAIF